MNRSKIVAIITGAISILLAIAYLILVQLLDFRGEMQPAPVSQLSVVSYQGAGSREQGAV
ncbi:hypothetical protein [Chroococcidiopsis sp.]|uniref:hypothetical protein n=1 Tax=Chroococcidiopsis sp. TaxID=3088168 RepID=UPI003F30AAAF